MLKCPHMTLHTRVLVWLKRAYSFKSDDPSDVQGTTSSTKYQHVTKFNNRQDCLSEVFFSFFLCWNIQQKENNLEQTQLLHNMTGGGARFRQRGRTPRSLAVSHQSWASLPLPHWGSGFLPCLWLPQRMEHSICSTEVRERHSCGKHRLCELPGLEWDLRVRVMWGSVVKTRR